MQNTRVKPRPRSRLDAAESADWRPAGRARTSKRAAAPPDPCRLVAADLARLEPIHQLLSELNDAYAGSRRVTELVAAMPVLSARCLRAAAGRVGADVEVPSIERALNLIGNRGLETVLLGLLEDLTILKADLEAGEAP